MIKSLRHLRRGALGPPPAEPERAPAGTSTTTGSQQETLVTAAVAWVARWSLRLLIIAAAAVGCLYLLGQLWVVVLPALLALLLSTVLWPPARLLHRMLPASAAAGLALIGGLIPLVGLGALMGALVSAQAEELSDAVIEGLEDVQNWTTQPPLNLGDEDLGGLIDRALMSCNSVLRKSLAGLCRASMRSAPCCSRWS